METKEIILKTSDNYIVTVDEKIVKKSKLISGLIEDYGSDGETPLNEIDKNTLDTVIEYLQHYSTIEPKKIPTPFPERTDETFFKGILNDNWTYDYLKKMGIEKAIKLVNAANYLQIDGLLDILAAFLAHEMSNCDVEEARKKFGIECDMTEKEAAEYDKYPLD